MDLSFDFRALRTGNGYDAHRLAEGQKLKLCGVEIPYELGLLGHSDADVAVHALIDALLGACGYGDIGRMFPPDDARYKDISSIILLERAIVHITSIGFCIINADITIIAQQPKLAPYIDQMKSNIASACNTSHDAIGIKATTTEGMGFEGRGEGISAFATALLIKIDECETN